MAEEKEPREPSKEKTSRVTALELATAVIRVTSAVIPRVEGDIREVLIELQQLALDYLEGLSRRAWRNGARAWRGGGRRGPRF